MAPRGDFDGSLSRDEEDIQQDYVLANGDSKGFSGSTNNRDRGTWAGASNSPPSRFATIIEANDDYKKILEVMDKLRVFDASHELSLPQLVVCGEQSAGKSSVLEAISGIPFPRKGSQCTRFVTQYVDSRSWSLPN